MKISKFFVLALTLMVAHSNTLEARRHYARGDYRRNDRSDRGGRAAKGALFGGFGGATIGGIAAGGKGAGYGALAGVGLGAIIGAASGRKKDYFRTCEDHVYALRHENEELTEEIDNLQKDLQRCQRSLSSYNQEPVTVFRHHKRKYVEYYPGYESCKREVDSLLSTNDMLRDEYNRLEEAIQTCQSELEYYEQEEDAE